MRVLLVEDHEEMAAVIARGLRREGLAVDVAPTGRLVGSRSAFTTMTWSSWTATCRFFT